MKEVDYTKSYNEVLDIKDAYTYKRQLGKIPFNHIGMEIEISVNYDRHKYSFIKNILKKVKEAVSDNGFFVSDATVLGDYQFEIVLDPLSVEEILVIFEKIKNIIEHSCGSLEMNESKKCGIHLNFNKYDIKNKQEAHKRLTTLILENKEYFEVNNYKPFKFIWEYKEYFHYQKTVGSKYMAVNYLSKNLVEVRNIDPEISLDKLGEIMNLILVALYKELYSEEDVKILETKQLLTKKNISKLLEKSFENVSDKQTLEKIIEDKILVISFKDKKPKLMTLDELKGVNYGEN